MNAARSFEFPSLLFRHHSKVSTVTARLTSTRAKN